MTDQLIECVPNFSEGNDPDIIAAITAAVQSVDGVKLLHVDQGKAANRTVVTFAGRPEAVVEAAFRAIKTAGEKIDMRKHKGEHPRIGATDVCPLIPISNISMEETVKYSRTLGKRVGEELGIPVYLYESSATRPERRNLATVRSGEYEGLAQKILQKDWQPDFGSSAFNPQSGATVIGARDFLIAYNINLDTADVNIANAIAVRIRETGGVKRVGVHNTGEVERDASGQAIRIPGMLKAVKAIGWYIKEYKKAQVSTNIINYKITPFHKVYEEARKAAELEGVSVTGSELIGLIPLQAMLDAGRYFADKKGGNGTLSQDALIALTVKEMGLDELAPFDPTKKIIDFLL